MGAVERRHELLQNIARLRRAERELPPNRDLAAVRTALEEELGETVSLRAAARLLGVSHTALRRWTTSGDLPLVIDAGGRSGVPVAALLDLEEAVAAERRAGTRERHVLEPVIGEQRARAERLSSKRLVPSDGGDGGGHRRAERRSLAYHRALARRLRRPMVDDALRQIWKWRARGAIDARYADEWERLLRRPVAEIRRAIGEDDEAAAALRQTSPFAGMLSEAERHKILSEVR
jgi:hypothetical protein